jgi:outer membrane protein TolC
MGNANFVTSPRLRASILFLVLCDAASISAQTVAPSPVRAWNPASAQPIRQDAKGIRGWPFALDSSRIWSLAELIDVAEEHNPETRVAWERARAQLALWGVARSELYPTLVTAVLAQGDRDEILFGDRFVRQTVFNYGTALDLSYTVFDSGARAGRIEAAKAEALAANFAFNDTHRNVIYEVERAYYRLQNAIGQEEAARASLANAQTVQRAAEDRLKHGLATLPDVLEARSASAQAEYDLQAVMGIEAVSRGDLATALAISPATPIRVQSIYDERLPDSIEGSVEQAIQRAFEQRPDLLQQLAEVRSAYAGLKQARARFYPALGVRASTFSQPFYGLQQALPWAHTADLTGQFSIELSRTLFDGGARRNSLRRAEADLRVADTQVEVLRDRIANEIWTAYSNLTTAFGQRQAATAFLDAARESYAAALESYNYGLRNLLDVTAAQRVLAQARSTDVTARTQVLAALAELAFAAADLIQPGAKRP